MSESAKRRPEPRVAAWWSEQAAKDLFIASFTIGELVRGVRKIREPAMTPQYEDWVQKFVMPQFAERVLPFDKSAAVLWGEMRAASEREGRSIPPLDAQIAAIAKLHTLTLVTLNVRDFQRAGIPVLDPRAAEAPLSSGTGFPSR